jgi:hypothetical protein
MKRKNRESLRMALREYQHATRVFLSDQQQAMYEEEHGINGPTSPTAHRSQSDWMMAMELLEEAVERVLEDER